MMSRSVLQKAKSTLGKLEKASLFPPSTKCCGECAISSCDWYDYAYYVSLKNKKPQLEYLILKVENPPQEPKVAGDDDGSPYCQWVDYFEKNKQYKIALKILESTFGHN